LLDWLRFSRNRRHLSVDWRSRGRDGLRLNRFCRNLRRRGFSRHHRHLYLDWRSRGRDRLRLNRFRRNLGRRGFDGNRRCLGLDWQSRDRGGLRLNRHNWVCGDLGVGWLWHSGLSRGRRFGHRGTRRVRQLRSSLRSWTGRCRRRGQRCEVRHPLLTRRGYRGRRRLSDWSDLDRRLIDDRRLGLDRSELGLGRGGGNDGRFLLRRNGVGSFGLGRGLSNRCRPRLRRG
jgi:hypothetical protein